MRLGNNFLKNNVRKELKAIISKPCFAFGHISIHNFQVPKVLRYNIGIQDIIRTPKVRQIVSYKFCINSAVC